MTSTVLLSITTPSWSPQTLTGHFHTPRPSLTLPEPLKHSNIPTFLASYNTPCLFSTLLLVFLQLFLTSRAPQTLFTSSWLSLPFPGPPHPFHGPPQSSMDHVLLLWPSQPLHGPLQLILTLSTPFWSFQFLPGLLQQSLALYNSS